MKIILHRDGFDQFEQLYTGDPIDTYTDKYSGGVGLALSDATEELLDRNGGFAFDEDGNWCKYVAPYPNNE